MLHILRRTSSGPSIVMATFALILSFVGIMMASPAVNALESERDRDMRMNESTSDSKSDMNHESHTRVHTEQTVAERRAVVNEKLTTAKLKACEKRQANVNNRTERIAARATKHLGVFTTISERVQDFYTTKGYAVENYDSLLAEVNTAKATAETTVAEISSKKASFSCEDNPRQGLVAFKESLKASTTALKDYRTAIKNLIVAVKSANNNTDSTRENTSTEEAR